MSFRGGARIISRKDAVDSAGALLSALWEGSATWPTGGRWIPSRRAIAATVPFQMCDVSRKLLTGVRARGTVRSHIKRRGRMSARICSLGVVLAFALMGWAACSTDVQAANFLEMNFWLSGPRYNAAVPLCDEPAALGTIQSRFSEKEGHFWNSDLQIVGFDQVREIAFRPWAEGTIPRRFCSATALVSDGVKRHLNYSIGEDTGIIGVTWGVEWCVVGLDRNWAYNPACKMARP
jgi:hypothetical protein